MKIPSRPKTKAYLGKDDAVSKDKDLLDDQYSLTDGALWGIQDMSIDSTKSDNIIFKQIGVGSDFELSQISGYITAENKAQFRERLARIISCLFSLVKAQP
jgi:hypothetical protein